ncbi:MAG: PAS domain S-box protein [Nitrospirota bacterium]|nr:PAS domain S-box protein [Nitrospirota bacterium]
MNALRRRVAEFERLELLHREDEARLRRLATILEDSNDAVTAQDLDGTITAWNKGAERMYGYSEAEALGMNISRIIPEDGKKDAGDIIEKIRSGHPIESLETARVTKDGRVLDVWLTITKLVDNDGTIVGVATTERDITNIKKNEEALNRYLNLSMEFNREPEPIVAERTLGLIALTVADKVRNPATAIGLKCRHLIEKATDTETLKDGLREIADEAGKLESIVNDFRTVFRKRKAEFVYEDINRIVRDACDFAQQEARERVVAIDFRLHNAPLKIYMQKKLLTTALFYLVLNAVDLTPRTGRVTITTGREENMISLTIATMGSSIGKEKLAVIFDPLADTQLSRSEMLLPIVKYIAQEHFGDIRIESNERGGTSFKMTFPESWFYEQDTALKPLLT